MKLLLCSRRDLEKNLPLKLQIILKLRLLKLRKITEMERESQELTVSKDLDLIESLVTKRRKKKLYPLLLQL